MKNYLVLKTWCKNGKLFQLVIHTTKGFYCVYCPIGNTTNAMKIIHNHKTVGFIIAANLPRY